MMTKPLSLSRLAFDTLLISLLALALFRSYSLGRSMNQLHDLVTLITSYLNLTVPSAVKVTSILPDESFFIVPFTDEEEVVITSSKEYSKAWAKIVASTLKIYTQSGIDQLQLSSCKDISTFFTNFLADGAPLSIPSFMESIGDSSIVTSPWSSKNSKSRATYMTRTISYMHPVTNPLAGTPKAKAIKRQRFKKYGSYGILLESETQVIGVPKTDCFVTREVMLVQPAAGKKGVVVSSRFQIVFTKSTMFKSIISTQTSSELKAWHKGYGKMISSSTVKQGGSKGKGWDL